MGIPTEPPHDFTGLFSIENGRLLSLLRSLSPADWHRPSPCPGWDVHGLATHLLGGSFSVISWLRDGFRGTPAPDGLDEQGFITWLDDLQASWVDAARRLSPELVIELLDWSIDGFIQALDTDDPTAIRAHVSWASAEPVPAWLDHARELTEKWIHRQQILQALDQPADLTPDLALPVLDALRWAYPYRLGRHVREPGAYIDINIDDQQIGQRWRLVSNGASWVFDDAGPKVMLASMSLTADQAWRLLTNNYDPGTNGVLLTTGDRGIVATLMLTRAIIGTPK